MSPSSNPFHFKVSQQGLLLVTVLLVLEFVFVGFLWHLLSEAETEARKEEHYKELSVATNRIVELNYVAIYSLRDYIATHDGYHDLKYVRAIKDMKKNLDWLQANLEDQPYQLEIVKRIRSRFQVAFNIIDQARTVMSNGGTLADLSMMMRRKGEFDALNKELAPDFQALLSAQRRLERTAPEIQKQLRNRYKTALLSGLALNVVAAVFMALFFTRGIVKRLEILVDNTSRLKKGETLRPRLSGNDEIVHLDRVFHEMASDLTEAACKERAALDEAREAESRVRQVINSMPVGLFIVDIDGTIFFANPQAAQMLSYSSEELDGVNFLAIIAAPQSEARTSEPLMEVISKELAEHSTETTAKKKDGSTVEIELSVTPFDRFDQKRFLITTLDITERIEVQRLRQALVAMVSHELRTPLTSVRGFLELLEMGALGDISDEARDGVCRASNNIERLISLIHDLLDLEKMESGTITLEPRLTNVKEMIETSVGTVKELAERKDITIDYDSKSSASVDVHCDNDRIVQVIVNLLSNALKFAPEGSSIEIAVEEPQTFVEFSVSDQGPGIPADSRLLIFERFHQVTSKDHPGGTGLGLAICKAIVEQHGGAIGVEDARNVSKEGKDKAAQTRTTNGATCRGSRFWFRLPAASVSNAEQERSSKESVRLTKPGP